MNAGDSDHNTIFLRIEGPLQAWGDTSKFVIRRTMDAPTKSGVLGLICCAMGLSRQAAREHLPELNTLSMGVRIDRLGTRWWDYHTVGAGIGLTTAGGGVKKGAQGTLITRREYLADASFLVALQGEASLIMRVAQALRSPTWSLYLGRKSCPPSAPVFAQPRAGESWTNPMAVRGDIKAALEQVPWCPRYKDDAPGDASMARPCLLEWRADTDNDMAPPDAEVWYDTPFSLDPPVHHPRLLTRDQVTLAVGPAIQQHTPGPPRPRANYRNREWRSDEFVELPDPDTGKLTEQRKGMRPRRLEYDHGLCVFCKQEASTVQHITYRHAGGDERLNELAALCRLCHDAVTMIEYGLGMGIDRIDPTDPKWRDQVIDKRDQIIRFRSEEARRRALNAAPKDARKERLEEVL